MRDELDDLERVNVERRGDGEAMEDENAEVLSEIWSDATVVTWISVVTRVVASDEDHTVQTKLPQHWQEFENLLQLT